MNMKRRKFISSTLATAVLAPSIGLSNAARPKKGIVVRAGKDRFDAPIKYRGVNPNDVKVSTRDTEGQLAIFEYVGFEKIGPPLHVHFNQDETFYVVEGTYLVQVGEEKYQLTAGDTIFLPRNVPHTWLQLSEKGKMFYLVQPAGKMEAFFEKMNALPGPPTEAQVQQIHLEHEMKILGPPLQE
jgi:quercetin dioxygenase-like cupin family protein